MSKKKKKRSNFFIPLSLKKSNTFDVYYQIEEAAGQMIR